MIGQEDEKRLCSIWRGLCAEGATKEAPGWSGDFFSRMPSFDWLFSPAILIRSLNYRKISNNWTMCYVVGNSLPGKRGKNRSKKGAAQPLWQTWKIKKNTRPYQRRQLQRHSTLFNYSRFYGKPSPSCKHISLQAWNAPISPIYP